MAAYANLINLNRVCIWLLSSAVLLANSNRIVKCGIVTNDGTTVAPTVSTTASSTTPALTTIPTGTTVSTTPGSTLSSTTLGTTIPTTTPSSTTTIRPSLPTIPSALVDPRADIKLNDVELVRFGNDVQQVQQSSSDAVQFPRDKRSTISQMKRIKRETCTCYLTTVCPGTTTGSTDGSGLIDFRIVLGGNINYNTTVICPAGYKYCCTSSSSNQQSCGSRLQTSVIYPTTIGQAKYGDFPWMAMIMTLDSIYVGGGVLIDMQNVLTTAHRIASYPNGANLKIRLGEWDVSANYEQYPYKDFSISRVWIHEAFNAANLHNDIAVIRLAGGISTGTPAVNPICLPTAGQLFDGQRCWVSGWGKDSYGTIGQYQSVLKAADVPVLPATSCETALKSTRLGPAFVLDRTSFICAGGESNKDACTGDGGSGLVCETTPGRWVLAGLVAWGLGCATQGVPAGYVNIVTYLPWISNKQASY